jgi:hypothetical protein
MRYDPAEVAKQRAEDEAFAALVNVYAARLERRPHRAVKQRPMAALQLWLYRDDLKEVAVHANSRSEARARVKDRLGRRLAAEYTLRRSAEKGLRHED